MLRSLLLTCFVCFTCLSFAQVKGNISDKVIYRKVKTEDLVNVNEVYHYNGKPYTGTSYDNFPSRNTKMQEMNWIDGLLDGTKTEYFTNGATRSIMNFKAGKRHGEFINYHDNGQLKLTGSYINDLLDQALKSYYNNGKLKYVHNYSNGARVGESILYFKNGNIEQYVTLKDEKPDGVMKTFYWAGNPRQEIHYKDGERNGLYIDYHLTGLVAERSYYKNGYKDSLSLYYDNVFGVLMKSESYALGKRNGLQINYNEGGDTISYYNFKNDTLHGDYKVYFAGIVEFGSKSNGKKKKFNRKKSDKRYINGLDEYGSFVNGLRDGEFKKGLVNKETHVEGHYSLGVMVGEWKYYNAKGKLVLHEKYNDDGDLIYQMPEIKKEEEEESNED